VFLARTLTGSFAFEGSASTIPGKTDMNKHAPLAIALLLAATAGASAADLGWGAPANTGAGPVFSPTSAFNWSGFYAGVSGGYGWGTITRDPVAGAIIEDDLDGWNLGAHAGYNVDFGGFVVGVEGDANWTDMGYSQELGAAGTFDAGLDGFGSVRMRAGASFGQVMPYVTGGIGVGKGTVGTTAPNGVTNTQSQWHTGWVLGGGLEAAATENVTLRAEYLHYNLGAQPYDTAAGTEIAHSFGTVRAGLSYKF
jgi:outer membrane immunogenic protein